MTASKGRLYVVRVTHSLQGRKGVQEGIKMRAGHTVVLFYIPEEQNAQFLKILDTSFLYTVSDLFNCASKLFVPLHSAMEL